MKTYTVAVVITCPDTYKPVDALDVVHAAMRTHFDSLRNVARLLGSPMPVVNWHTDGVTPPVDRPPIPELFLWGCSRCNLVYAMTEEAAATFICQQCRGGGAIRIKGTPPLYEEN